MNGFTPAPGLYRLENVGFGETLALVSSDQIHGVEWSFWSTDAISARVDPDNGWFDTIELDPENETDAAIIAMLLPFAENVARDVDVARFQKNNNALNDANALYTDAFLAAYAYKYGQCPRPHSYLWTKEN